MYLQAVGELATLLALFSVSALCEISIPENTNSAILVLFGTSSAVVV
jgi:hypothetical protein